MSSLIRGQRGSGNVIEDRKFIFTKVESGNNKYWRIRLYDSGDVEKEWGKVIAGSDGQLAPVGNHQFGTIPGGGRTVFEDEMHDKTRPQSKYGGDSYTEVKTADNVSVTTSTVSSRSLNDIAKQQISHNDPEVAKLIDYLVKTNRHNIVAATGGKVQWNAQTGMFTTPFGVITPDVISEARTFLVTLGDCVANRDWDSTDFFAAVNKYLRLVPHDLGYGRPNMQAFLPDLNKVQAEGQLLDALEASFNSGLQQPKTKKADAPKVFDVKLTLNDDSKCLRRISDYYENSKNRAHVTYNYRIRKIYEVQIGHMATAFEKHGKPMGTVMELWHGTKASNLLSILKSGFMIPPSGSPHVTGRMFSDGVYFANQSTKALNYATSFWGGSDEGRYFMFLADVAMGKYYVPRGPTSSLPPRGYDSYYAQAGKSGVQNNELIVFKTCQINPTFLIEFSR